jgi:hypothetical protein
MQNNNGDRDFTALARRFVTLCAALIVAPGSTASAAPTETVLHSFTGSDGLLPAVTGSFSMSA